jgi:hypothetical protein
MAEASSNTIQIRQTGERKDMRFFVWHTQNKQQRSQRKNPVMSLKLHGLPEECKLSTAMHTQILQDIYPISMIERILSACATWERRQRKLTLLLIVWMVITMNWYPKRSQIGVLSTLARGARFLWPSDEIALPGASALPYRREQVGTEPLRQLMRQACVPLATDETNGAFRLGSRVMAIDGTWQNVANTPANEAAFGRFQMGTSQSAFPQVRCVLLVECGTHAIVDVDLDACRRSEHHGAHRLLRSLTSDMLVTLDAGFLSVGLWYGIRQRDAHVLGMVPSDKLQAAGQRLSDGSVLTRLAPSRTSLYPCKEAVPVRVISYRILDPQVGKPEKIFRLATTLLDPVTAPATELITLYHERWEAELVIDELKTHQHLCAQTLRSQTPEGVRQELYGWFLAHYALRAWMHRAALQADLDPDQLSLTQALTAVDEALFSFALVAPQDHPRIIHRLLLDLSAHPLPPRRFRINARVVKQPRSKWKRKWPKHDHGPHLKNTSFLDVVLLI